MDTTRDILYRAFLLNDSNIRENIDADTGIGKGITGSVVDSWDFSDVDVVQNLQKKSLRDGQDAGDVFLGQRRLRIAGTLYGKTRALLFDNYWELRRVLNPVLAQRESPADKGYLPLYYSVPTNRIVDYPLGTIDMRLLAMPRAQQLIWQRDQQGGEDHNSLAIPWQATFVCKDPSIMADVPLDYDLSAGGTVAGNFANRGTYIAPLNMLIVVGAAAGTIAVSAGGAENFIITVPASTGNRTIRYKGDDGIVTFEEPGQIEGLRMGSIPLTMVHPTIPAGISAYSVTFTGVSVQAGSHMWFWETYA
jgi:hypothetical protein